MYQRYVLIGFMGAGKTSVGQALSQRLDFNFVDLDQLILEQSSVNSIGEIFTNLGEERFRELETEAANSLVDAEEIIIATCGGAISRRETMMALINSPEVCVIFLKTGFNTSKARLLGDNSRPLFADEDSARKLWEKRQAVYQGWATRTVDTDELSIAQVVAAILREAADEA